MSFFFRGDFGFEKVERLLGEILAKINTSCSILKTHSGRSQIHRQLWILNSILMRKKLFSKGHRTKFFNSNDSLFKFKIDHNIEKSINF